jgi:hypothetical protein
MESKVASISRFCLAPSTYALFGLEVYLKYLLHACCYGTTSVRSRKDNQSAPHVSQGAALGALLGCGG